MFNFLKNFAGLPRGLTKQELIEIQELNRIAQAEAFKAGTFAANTALLNFKGATPGKALAEQQNAIASMMERVKNEHVNAKLAQLGYPAGSPLALDLQTGRITKVQANDTRTAEKTA